MAALVRAHDWSTTPLGLVEHWPQSLRNVVSLVLSSPHPMYLACGPKLVVIHNDAYVPVLGAKADRALGTPFADLWPEAWDQVQPLIERTLSGEGVWAEDMPVVLERNGYQETAYFTFSYSPLWDEAGRCAGLLATVTETTDRVRAERENAGLLERVQEVATQLQQMFEQAPGFIALLSGPNHVLELANRAYYQLVGHRDIIGKPVFEALPDVRKQGFEELLDRVIATGEPFIGRGLPLAVQREPGAPQAQSFVDLAFQPIFAPDGTVRSIFVQGHEVTEQYRAMAALRESEERYRLLVESAKDYAIVGMDAAGRITSWNTGAERLMGYCEAEAIGQSAALCFTPEDRAAGAPEQEITDARERGRFEDERWHQRKDGSRFWGSGLVVPQADDPRRGLLKILRDRTAERLAESEREALVAALQDADRRKDEFLATLAHELRNPLAPLRNVASLLKRSGPTPAQQPLLEIMDRQVGQLRRLVEDLLEISRITQGKITLKREPMRVSNAVYAAPEAIQPHVDQRHQVLEARVSSSAIVDIDAARITQVVTNLLNNAAKFTPEGGRIVLDAFDEADAVIVRVHDEGIGIAPEVLPRVFDLFAQGSSTTVDQAQGGLGIGLSLVKRLVEMHGGTVQARSEGLGKGACFAVHLPRGEPPASER